MIDFSQIDLKELACFVYETLRSNGVEAILVGGACVSIYSQNRYQSYDLDFVTYQEMKLIEEIFSKFGFKRTGRCFSKSDCPYVIDFVNPPVAVGHESVRHFETLKTPTGSLQLLTPTDCVKDRLCAFFYWNDEQAFEQAILVAKAHPINLSNLKRWAIVEGHQEKLGRFLKKL